MSAPENSPDLPSPKVSLGWRATLSLLQRLPQAGLSRLLGRIADVPVPPALRASVFGTFARAVGADLSEVELPLAEYPTVNAFFVRRLKPGLRSWPEDPAAVAAPVDGIVGTVGEIRGGTAVQAKGREYPVAELLGDERDAQVFDGGRFITLYLSPRHYHRIHAPVSGTIPLARHIPGGLLPVNVPSVAHIPDLFVTNERLLCLMDSRLGRVAVVAVGAYNVARISTAFDRSWGGERAWVSNRREPVPRERTYNPPIRVERGSELMAFHLGSTVVLLLPPGAAEPTAACRPGSEVRLGEALARPVRPGHLSAP
ncbi:MAG: phosphatidylserine decarboxylase [Gemmatimonadetes bacterium]|nr:phosphatidylserine decarboxylase [Gemmatimonadota bacterium]